MASKRCAGSPRVARPRRRPLLRHDVTEFGGVWRVIRADGTAVR